MSDPSKEKYTNSMTVKYSKSLFDITLEELVTFDNLFYAYKSAYKNKRHRNTIFRFEDNFGNYLTNLQTRLLNGTYTPKPCFQFDLFCISGQKVRHISAPAFEDCIVQHLLYQNVYPYFDKALIYDSYGCRRGKGTHKASDRFQEFLKRSSDDDYILQLDVRKYYYRIDHEVLKECLERRVKDKRIVDLFMMFLNHEDGVGLMVGNLLSQLYGMIYLDRLDHYIKRVLKVKYYVRYVDDMIMVLPSREEAVRIRDDVSEYLDKYLKLELSKWRVNTVNKGANFVGFRTWKHKRIIRRRSLYNYNRKVRANNLNSVISILGHAKHTSCYPSFLNKAVTQLNEENLGKLPKVYKEDAKRFNLL